MKGLIIWYLFVLGLLLTTGALPTLPAPRQVKVVPGSTVRGEAVLDNNACLNCHALNGRGGKRAPDFAGLSGRDRSPAFFAISMWNHMPRMWSEYEAAGLDVVPLASSEAADLFAFFYASLYFAPQGNALRGKAVFGQKNCVSCHSEVLDVRPVSELKERWTEETDPITWAERMWNHSNEMDVAMANRGLRWPELSERDVADLLVFLSGLSTTNTERPEFSVGEPERGRLAFERSCESCHSFGNEGGSRVDLLRRSSPDSVIGYVAAMWNHAPSMRRRGGSNLKLNSGEMRDLVAYLFSQYYFFEQGNPSNGRRVYEAKRCANCHEQGAVPVATSLDQSTEVYSPITLTAAAWRHGPSMLRSMKQQGIPWPEFQDSEMKDLIAYLNSRLISRIGRKGD